jgi:hypothetical protein
VSAEAICAGLTGLARHRLSGTKTMTISKLAAGVAGALFVALAGSAAFAAHGAGLYLCQTWSPAKAGPPVTHCVTWTREAAARMRAAACDPANMTSAAMRAQCSTLAAGPEQTTPPPAAG